MFFEKSFFYNNRQAQNWRKLLCGDLILADDWEEGSMFEFGEGDKKKFLRCDRLFKGIFRGIFGRD